MSFDLVIRNGTIVDGSGLPAYRADLGISDGLITSIGRLSERGGREIDAEGQVVTPGFIDGHTHMDAQVFWDPQATCSCWHGVTTVVMGHCGFTLAPARAAERPLVVRNLERAEDISATAMAAGIDWTWETFVEYLDAVDQLPKGINYAANIGHSALRTWAMGERAFEQEASERDLEVMERELSDALRAGAMGLTTSRSPTHETSDDRPVASRLASWEEVRRLVSTMGALGAGIFQLSAERAARSPNVGEREEYFGRIRTLALESHVPMAFAVLATREGLASLELIDSTVDAGGRMFGLTASRGFSHILSFKTHLPFDVLPEWKAIRALPEEEQKKFLSNPDVREELVRAANQGDYGFALGLKIEKPDYDLMQVLDSPIPAWNPTVAEIAKKRGLDPVEVIIDLSIASNFDQMFTQANRRFSEEDLLTAMKHPRTVMAFSDSGAHVSQIMDSSIQTHLFAYWVRERQAFTIEEAVRMLTLSPATAWGFADRGLLRKGFIADINVFDPVTIAPELPTVATDLPGGAMRLKQRAKGVLATIVGGEITLSSGEPTGALPGKLVRGPLVERRI